MRFKSIILSLVAFLTLSCANIAPTPILSGRAIYLNDHVVQLYTACSEGANFVIAKEGCDPELLNTKVDELMSLSVKFISADIRQSLGYDIHLATAMIYFRIAERTLNDYTRAEQISRQFFEVQKAHTGGAVTTARFYLVWFTSATASKQYYEDKAALTPERGEELLFALNEGSVIIGVLEGPRLVRIRQANTILQFVIMFIQ